MAQRATIVVDTNVLLNLATPVVDGRPRAPTGEDPLKAVLTAYDVQVPSLVIGEVTEAARSDDLLGTAASAVLAAADHLTTHDVDDGADGPTIGGLDAGESRAIRLANVLDAAMLVTDEFNGTNYVVIGTALDDGDALFTTPHVLCALADHGVLNDRYVDTALSYYVETKSWDENYVAQLRDRYLDT